MPFWRSVIEREARGVKYDFGPSAYVYKDPYQQPERYQEVRSASCRLPPAEKSTEAWFSFSGYEQNRFFHNAGGGRFEEIGGAAGLGRLEDGRSFVRFDYDRDGDEDLFLWNSRRGTMILLRNEVGQDSNFVGLQLRGAAPNRFAVGAKVTVRTAGGISVRAISCGEGYLSCHPPEALVGVGRAEKADVEIRWPSGAVQTFGKVSANAWYAAEEGAPALKRLAYEPVRKAAEPAAPRPRISEGEPFAGSGLVVALATVEELEEFGPLKARGGRLLASPLDLEAMTRAVGSASGWTITPVPDDGWEELLGPRPLLPCILVVDQGRVKAKFAGVGAGGRAARWLARP